MSKKEEFTAIYKDNIHRQGSDDLFNWIENSDFFYAPASTKFHGAYEGGLVEHSVNVYDCLVDELELEFPKDVYTKETVAIVALLHDLCKTNFYKKSTRNVKVNGYWTAKEVYEIDDQFPVGHSEKSIIIVQQFMALNRDEILAMRSHMGGWDDSAKYVVGKSFELCPLAVLLHVADIKASYLMEGAMKK